VDKDLKEALEVIEDLTSQLWVAYEKNGGALLPHEDPGEAATPEYHFADAEQRLGWSAKPLEAWKAAEKLFAKHDYFWWALDG
jgi:hypothetical protein